MAVCGECVVESWLKNVAMITTKEKMHTIPEKGYLFVNVMEEKELEGVINKIDN